MDRTKLALLVAASLALSAARAAADPVLATSDVNLRSGPGTQYPLVGRIPGGSTVEAVNCNVGWCEAQFNGRAGYVNQSYLDFGGDAQAAPVQVRPYPGGPPPGAIPVAPPGSYPPPAGYYPPPADYAPPPPVYREPPSYGYPPYDPPPVYGPGYRRDGAPPPRHIQRVPDGGRAQGAPQHQPAAQVQQRPNNRPPGKQQSAPAAVVGPAAQPQQNSPSNRAPASDPPPAAKVDPR
jgi:uncharacterized protein YraI